MILIGSSIIYMVCLSIRSFAINIGHDKDSLALHFNPRFKYKKDRNVIVCNSNRGGWGKEQREHNFPFQHNEAFKVTFWCLQFPSNSPIY